MISISQNLVINNQNRYKYGAISSPINTVPDEKVKFRGEDVSELISKGNKYLNENKFNEAISYYNQAIERNSKELKAYRQMAKAQFGLKNYQSAQENFKKYLKENPDDIDIIIELGETQRLMGRYNEALSNFENAYILDSSNDLAKRSILTTKNNMEAIFFPQKAKKEKEEYAQQNLTEALRMTIDYLTPEYMEKLSTVNFQFGKTASMGGTGNIAQYENTKNTITVSDSYVYASPQVIAAYLTHESVHAYDNDPYTSVTEEQDAYEAATKFWIHNANGIKDPEMDYAAELYKKSSETLKNRVKEIYTLRDPYIPMTSPNHPPQNPLYLRKINDTKAASQSIRVYDVIA